MIKCLLLYWFSSGPFHMRKISSFSNFVFLNPQNVEYICFICFYLIMIMIHILVYNINNHIYRSFLFCLFLFVVFCCWGGGFNSICNLKEMWINTWLLPLFCLLISYYIFPSSLFILYHLIPFASRYVISFDPNC